MSPGRRLSGWVRTPGQGVPAKQPRTPVLGWGNAALKGSPPSRAVRIAIIGAGRLLRGLTRSLPDSAPRLHDPAPPALDLMPLVHDPTRLAHDPVRRLRAPVPPAHGLMPPVLDPVQLAHDLSPPINDPAPRLHDLARPAHDPAPQPREPVFQRQGGKWILQGLPLLRKSLLGAIQFRARQDQEGTQGRIGMNLQETLDTLKSLGTEQNRKVYKRHGAAENVFGVSSAELKNLKKKIKLDHELALGLWTSGNHDARMLAAMVADPKRMDRETLDAWAYGLRNYVETDALGGLAAKSPVARETLERWIRSDDEWTAAGGWTILAHLAMDQNGLPDEYFETHLATIERDLQGSKNRVRHQMNGALIAIGGSRPALEEKALAVASRIGKVEVDHGETECKTPDAAAYIEKMVKRRKT